MNIFNLAKNNMPLILNIVSSIGTIATGVTAVIANEKANTEIENQKALFDKELNSKDEFKIMAKHYSIPITIGTLTIAANIGSGVLNHKQQVSLLAAYGLATESYSRYKSHINEEESNEVCEKVQMEMINEDKERPFVLVDTFTGLEIPNMTWRKLLNAQLDLNYIFSAYGEATLDQFYGSLDVEPLPVDSEEFGWSQADGTKYINLNFAESSDGEIIRISYPGIASVATGEIMS